MSSEGKKAGSPIVEYVEGTLQRINDTWCYSTRKSEPVRKLFGKPVPAHIDAQYSHFIPNAEKKTSTNRNGIDTYFLNGLTNQDAELWRQEYGHKCMLEVHIDASTGRRAAMDLLTLDMYASLEPTSQPSAQPIAS